MTILDEAPASPVRPHKGRAFPGMTTPTTTFRWRSRYEKEAAGTYAAAKGLTLSQWLRRLALEAAGEPTDEPPSAEAGRRMASGEKDPWGLDSDD